MSFANDFRPFSLDDVVGQRFVVDIIKKTLEDLPSVILFSGPHGVGKTSLARMVSAIANCTSDNRLDLPCGLCRDCKMIKSGCHVDILEFDAASNTGVDDIRDIIESANYSPIEAKFKVYIIDEVHMLSNSAFNALLKILEEPPKRAMFIMATTEREKIPLTIISRCMNFDLKKIGFKEISNRISFVANRSGFNIDVDAADFIASVACGSMRDALFILEQVCILSSCAKIDKNFVLNSISAIDPSKSIDILEAIFFENFEKIIYILDDFYERGKCMELVCEGILSMLNSFLLISVFSDKKSFGELDCNISDSEILRVKQILKNIGLSSVTRAFQIISNGMKSIKESSLQLYSARMLFITTSLLCKVEENCVANSIKKKINDESSMIYENANSDSEAKKPKEENFKNIKYKEKADISFKDKIFERYIFVRSLLVDLGDNELIRPFIYNFLDLAIRNNDEKYFYIHKNIGNEMFYRIKDWFDMQTSNEFFIELIDEEDARSIFYKDFLNERRDNFLKLGLVKEIIDFFDCDIENSVLQ